MNWTLVQDIIQQNQRFALTAHMFPDGDAVGSEMALYYHLISLGKEVVIVNNQPTYRVHDFLDPDNVIELFDEKKHPEILSQVDVVFILDVSSWDYMGQVGESVKKSSAVKVCIDHHVQEGKFVDVDYIDEKTCATGELVYDLFIANKMPITPEIATALYTAIITDTGVFRFSNTTAKSHLIAADLLTKGVDHTQIYQFLYERASWPQVNLLQHCLARLQTEADGKVAWIHVTEEIVNKAKASWDDSNSLIDFVRTIEGVKISIIFREFSDGTIKVHFRSKDGINVQQLADELGGGGHRVAAGASVQGPADSILPKIIEKAKALL